VLNYKQHILLLFKRLALLLLIYFISRVLFFLFNNGYFRELGFWSFWRLSFIGMRFDLCAIGVINSLFIVLSALPVAFIGNRGYQIFLRWLFYLTNSVGIAANCVDLAFYRFSLKRLTAGVFNLLGRKSDFLSLLPSFLKNYPWLFLLFALLVWLMVYLYQRTDRKNPVDKPRFLSVEGWLLNFLGFGLVIGFTVLGVRGGWQLIPISIPFAGEFTSPANIPFVINSPFSIIKTLDQPQLPPFAFYKREDLNQVYSAIHLPSNKKPEKLNVVVLILESFSKEFTGIGHRKSYTPFLDSLMKNSFVFDQAYSNGKRSAEGIPAILGGVPTLMDEPYNSSVYATNEISSLPKLLKPLGYTSSFFHGGTNGTMDFQSFAGIAGFDHYYGRNEYSNDGDFDGNWGIWDEPFLHYFAEHLNTMQEPFLSAVFTLSSHDPYLIPPKYAGKFPAGPLEIQATIGYTDYALQQFFLQAAKAPWFKNTIFVISPDHTGVSADPMYSNSYGQYSIPIFFYKPGADFRGSDSTTVQQIDILPSVLDLLGYDKPYFAFGHSAFDKSAAHFAVNYSGVNFQFFQNKHLLQFDGKAVTGYYNLQTDSLLQNNQRDKPDGEMQAMTRLLKAFLQTYEESLRTNHMTLNK
jgi:glucan phosphoethanolaminetransferase (alkaline phosphatase superfamily)